MSIDPGKTILSENARITNIVNVTWKEEPIMTEKRDTIWLIDDAEIIHKAVKVVLEGYDFRSFFTGEEFLDFIFKSDFLFFR